MKNCGRVALVAAVFAIGLGTVGALAAADSAAADLKCPTCSMKAMPEHWADWEGCKVSFCSDGCVAEFKKDAAKYAAKAHLQMVKSGQLTQTACPLTGRPMKDETAVDVAGVKVAFCCNNCKGKVEKAKGDEQVSLVFKDTSKGFKKAEKN